MRARFAGYFAGVGLLLAAPLDAATVSTFTVSAQVVPGCLVVGGATQYGMLDYGSQSALSTATLTAAIGGATVTLQCTPGVALSMSLDGGQNGAGGARNLKRAGGAQLLSYQLYRDAALAQGLGIGQSVGVAYSDPAAVKLALYGRVQLPGNLPPGTYSDVVQVTFSW
ncbi:Csu type fimbrial protein [Pseudomonas sp. S36]|uniref:Csu type fimbrial protein n=1 Tax=Pseudomonas sp. S36 TaxID=2767447 RepID=UPI00191438A0|nr:spore coat U domain-containing protein [Pseudomonas sp. S36]MBK4987988.1 spore coat protein U domain-containing protein [Pseudomonas sp. S36]